MPRHKRHEPDFCSSCKERRPFAGVHGFKGVVSRLRVNVGSQRRDFGIESGASKNERKVDAAEAGDEKGAVLFVVQRAGRAFEFADGCVAVYRNDEEIPHLRGLFEVGDMSAVQEVKAPVGEDDSVPCLRGGFAVRENFIKTQDGGWHAGTVSRK